MTIESQDTNAVTTPDILTVAQLNQAVNHLLEDSFAIFQILPTPLLGIGISP